MNSKLLPPYLYSREEFYRLYSEFESHGSSLSKYNGKIDYRTVAHIKRMEYLSYGVQEWLVRKAMNGCRESLEKLELGYDIYAEVQLKAKEETGILIINSR